MRNNNQFQLLTQRRFLPYFVTQFLSAFNDNVYRISLMILIATYFSKSDKATADVLVNVCAVLFILPFFLFSAIAGELADKFDKVRLIQRIRFSEIVIMTLTGFAYYLNNVYFLITILFFMGTKSSFFGPIKYSILPQYLDDTELVGGNGLVEMGTFLAILLGTIVGGVLIGLDKHATQAISITVLCIAVVGWLSSLFIPASKKAVCDLKIKIRWEPFGETWRTLKIAVEKKALFLSMLGISWFWFYGTSFLTQLPNYNERYLHGNEQVITLMLAAFSIGIAIGSLLCEKLSGHRVEIGLVPFGAIGLSIFAIDLSFAHGAYPALEVGVKEFISSPTHWRLLADLTLMGLFGGFYIVPLYVMLQNRSEATIRSRIIAANNILNALIMALGSGLAIVLLKVGLSIPQYFLIIGLLNALVTLYLFRLLPEFLLRFVVWALISSLYRIKVEGLENIPEEGPAIICSNHVSYLDPLILMATVKRPIRFVMDHRIFANPILKFLFKTAGCIPIAPAKEDPAIKELAFWKVAQSLQKNDLIGIFPEGGLTPDGSIQTFRPGVNQIVRVTPVPVIPIALQGMWGSWFSRRHGKAMQHIPRKFLWARIGVKIGQPIQPDELNRQTLQKIIEAMRGDQA